jgi:hypothetical protein
MIMDVFRRRRRLTPSDCLQTLPAPGFDVDAVRLEDDASEVELSRAVLRIAGLDHGAESAQVRATVVTARGAVPELGG